MTEQDPEGNLERAFMAADDELNARDGIGGNNPPPDSPFQIAQQEIDDLLLEAAAWLDGAEIEGQAQADALATLIDRLGKAWDKAEALRKEEKKPFDDGAKAVQARFKPILDKTDRAIAVGKAAQTKWLRKLQAAQQEAAEMARKLAMEEAAKAAAAARAATEAGNLEAREEAEVAIDKAMDLVSTAKMLSGLKANARGAEASRAMGLRTYKTAVLVDSKAALRAMWVRPDALAQIIEVMQRIAQADVRAGATHVDGYRIEIEERV